MAKLYYESDGDFGALAGKRIVVIGYGSQGHAHALNLRDSGADVTVAVRPGSEGWKRAEGHGWTPQEPTEAVKDADVIAIMVPDHIQAELWATIRDLIRPGATVLFTHGFSIHFGTVEVPEGVNVIMVAPKGPGHLVRRLYTEGAGVPALIAIEQDATGDAKQLAMALQVRGLITRRDRTGLSSLTPEGRREAAALAQDVVKALQDRLQALDATAAWRAVTA
ncbi:MAG: NAD(P)-binding domain-containing protein [Actinomycetota bacterium]